MKLLEQNGMHFVKCYSVLYHYVYGGFLHGTVSLIQYHAT